MATSKSRTSKLPSAPTADSQIDILGLPANVIGDRLNRAHAILDLICTASFTGDREMFFQQLSANTLEESLNHALNWIDEARAANNALAVAHV